MLRSRGTLHKNCRGVRCDSIWSPCRCIWGLRLLSFSLYPWSLASVWGDSVRAQGEAQYGIAISKNAMVAMRDGVRLSTDIYLPARNGQPVTEKFPAILERTPYNKDGGVPDSSGHIPPSPSDYLVPRGYVVVVQDVRGRYKSEGHWQGIKNDPDDGFDTAKWIGSQPWSNGKIGTIGTSYGGATQHALALANAPFVEAMIPIDAMSNFGRYGVRHNGAFELRFFNWIFTLELIATTNAPLAASRAAADSNSVRELLELGGHTAEYLATFPPAWNNTAPVRS